MTENRNWSPLFQLPLVLLIVNPRPWARLPLCPNVVPELGRLPFSPSGSKQWHGCGRTHSLFIFRLALKKLASLHLCSLHLSSLRLSSLRLCSLHLSSLHLSSLRLSSLHLSSLHHFPLLQMQHFSSCSTTFPIAQNWLKTHLKVKVHQANVYSTIFRGCSSEKGISVYGFGPSHFLKPESPLF